MTSHRILSDESPQTGVTAPAQTSVGTTAGVDS